MTKTPLTLSSRTVGDPGGASGSRRWRRTTSPRSDEARATSTYSMGHILLRARASYTGGVSAGSAPVAADPLHPVRPQVGPEVLRLGLIRCHADFIGSRHEVIETGARNDDHIAPTVRFFHYAEEASASILAKLDHDLLAFNLKFFAGDHLFHGVP